jgi:hypothetical protein
VTTQIDEYNREPAIELERKVSQRLLSPSVSVGRAPYGNIEAFLFDHVGDAELDL